MTLPGRCLLPLARAGYGSRAMIYAIIGFFAVLAAFGAGEKTGTRGALEKLLEQPFGALLVWLLILGFAGFCIWRLVQGLFDPDDQGSDARGLAVRGGLLMSAVSYGALAVYSLSLLGVLGALADGQGGGGRSVAETLNGIVGFKWFSLALGLGFVAFGVAHWRKALLRTYAGHFDATPAAMRIIHPISIVGLCARGVTFFLIAALLFYRFFTAGGEEESPPDLGDALNFVQGLPFGPWLLAACGLGLIAFAVYSAVEVKCRRVSLLGR